MSIATVTEAWPAARLTDIAVDWMREHYPGALIVPEFVCGDMGCARIDLAAIMPDAIHGVEVKGDGDSPTRLAMQGPHYSAVCSSVHLIWTPNDVKFASKVPAGWGRLQIEDGKAVSSGFYVGWRDALLSPHRMLGTIWRKELMRLCVRLRVSHDPKRSTVAQMTRDIADNIPLKEIRNGVCEILRERDWTQPTMNGGEPRRILQAAGPATAQPEGSNSTGEA